MGSNIFGTPVTEEMLKALPEYYDKKTISKEDKATVALEMKNAEGKDINAKRFVENLKSTFGDHVSTMCLIYNATGETIRFVRAHDWKGRLCESPYPVIIANGQWGAFLHGEYIGDYASVAAFVYSSFKKEKGKQWIMGFYNEIRCRKNSVYAEIRELADTDSTEEDSKSDKFMGLTTENFKEGKLAEQVEQNEGLLFTSIGNVGQTVFEAILTLPSAIK